MGGGASHTVETELNNNNNNNFFIKIFHTNCYLQVKNTVLYIKKELLKTYLQFISIKKETIFKQNFSNNFF